MALDDIEYFYRLFMAETVFQRKMRASQDSISLFYANRGYLQYPHIVLASYG
jgi:hypothetical protein